MLIPFFDVKGFIESYKDLWHSCITTFFFNLKAKTIYISNLINWMLFSENMKWAALFEYYSTCRIEFEQRIYNAAEFNRNYKYNCFERSFEVL